ncbi:nudC domain-containing protein 1-like [Panonychus citri]|uniref:nudC domain-containing protein 1-like n=1 Tax=Panonychus citri TaxID=50023 RepID=UPI00230778F1|nr:nudC domain-containing protein 1-like [Panonychus citri]
MTETIKLDVNRALIDPKFETYYLANQEVNQQSIDLPNSASEFTLPDKQLYSFLHFSAFSNDFNCLFTDPFNGLQSECYYVDNQLNVLSVEIDQSSNLINPPVCVFKVPTNNYQANECMVTLSFPSEEFVLILVSTCSTVGQADGHLSLLIVSTGHRQIQAHNWTVVKTINLSHEASFGLCWKNGDQLAKQLTCPAKLIDSNFHSRDDSDKLKVIILTVEKNDQEKFECRLNCLHLANQKMDTNGSSNWTIERFQQLTGPSYPSYIGVDTDKNGVLFMTIVSPNPFRLTFDSLDKPAANCDGQDEMDKDDERENIYFYFQDEKELTVNFKFPLDIQVKHIEVTLGIDEIEIRVKGETVFKETLWAQIDKELSCWKYERLRKDDIPIIEIYLIKKNKNQIWDQLFKGKEQGSHLPIESEQLRTLEGLNSLIVRYSEINESSDIPSIFGNEQCDEVAEDLTLYRINCHRHIITHQSYLTGHQWLFSRKLDNRLLPCFSLRHDVDACIWQPKVKGSRFHIEHIATFSALGYVQASKESKRFFNCSLDFDYSFIVDSNNHVYIYKQPAPSDGVVNRKKGVRPKIAKQKVINLGRELIQVLGSVAFKDLLLILSPKKLISIKIDF